MSYSNMNKLVKLIEDNDDRQKFIATHSSFVANKLGLANLIVCSEGKARQLTKVRSDDLKYFQKLPGYHTLRVILSERPVLVEGPTDEMIFDKAYFARFHKMPIENGVDVVVVDSLAFKRYLDVAKLVDKHVMVITDNDGDLKNLRNDTQITLVMSVSNFTTRKTGILLRLNRVSLQQIREILGCPICGDFVAQGVHFQKTLQKTIRKNWSII